MRRPSIQRGTLALGAILVSLLGVFAYVAARSGPLAPVPVVVRPVTSEPIAPALFGIGTVEARYTYRVGPTVAGRVARVDVHVGDAVRAGQPVGEMDPVDLEERIAAGRAALRRGEANVTAARAQAEDLAARERYAKAQAHRYGRLVEAGAVSQEEFEGKRQEHEIAAAGLRSARASLDAARRELQRLAADHDALVRQGANLRLVAPMDGLVSVRNAEPGSTLVAGQALVEIIDAATVWMNVRFDQQRAAGLRPGLSARIALRSHPGRTFEGKVVRVEPLADAITEETLAKVAFDALPEPSPPIGELGEITVALPEAAASPVVLNASIQRMDGRLGVWAMSDDDLQFRPVKLGAADLDGRVQILEGLHAGDHVVVHSHRALDARSRVKLVDHLPGVSP